MKITVTSPSGANFKTLGIIDGAFAVKHDLYHEECEEVAEMLISAAADLTAKNGAFVDFSRFLEILGPFLSEDDLEYLKECI